jgi:hypothetical protein
VRGNRQHRRTRGLEGELRRAWRIELVWLHDESGYTSRAKRSRSRLDRIRFLSALFTAQSRKLGLEPGHGLGHASTLFRRAFAPSPTYHFDSIAEQTIRVRSSNRGLIDLRSLRTNLNNRTRLIKLDLRSSTKERVNCA